MLRRQHRKHLCQHLLHKTWTCWFWEANCVRTTAFCLCYYLRFYEHIMCLCYYLRFYKHVSVNLVNWGVLKATLVSSVLHYKNDRYYYFPDQHNAKQTHKIESQNETILFPAHTNCDIYDIYFSITAKLLIVYLTSKFHTRSHILFANILDLGRRRFC